MIKLALVFLKIGVTAFGGPSAHIAMMETEFVRKRKWLTQEKFLDLMGATSLIPGPSSSELAMVIGQHLAGWAGLAVAGICFIFPAACIVLGLAWVYVRFGSVPGVVGALYGIKPVIIAIIMQAIIRLSRPAFKTKNLAAIGVLAFAMSGLGFSGFQILLSAGTGSMLMGRDFWKKWGQKAILLSFAMASLISSRETQAVVGEAIKNLPGLNRIFLFFLKVGSIQFGSGYVLLAFLRTDLVERWHWLTERQLLDATAVGQFTPGPVFTTATFIGYLLQGIKGAGVATVGIFLPAFIFVSLSGPLIPRIRKSAFAGAFLDGVNVASIALMASVSIQLGQAALPDGVAGALFLGSFYGLQRTQVHSAWLVLLGALVGYGKAGF